MQLSTRFALALCALLAALCLQSNAQVPKDRLTAPVNDWNTVTVRGNVHPAALAAANAAPAQSGLPMQHMILLLQPDANQQAALDQLIQQQHDPKSPSYGKFLSPQDFGNQFGVSPNDVKQVVTWLQNHGFTIDEIPAGKNSIVFSGTSDGVAAAFGTQIRRVSWNGQTRYANDSDPHVPAALAGVVSGIVKLHNFPRNHSATAIKAAPAFNSPAAQYTYGSGHYLAPADYAVIYDIKPLYAAGVDGSGQSIAVVARSNISISDVQTFRSEFGLPANNPSVIVINSDPGMVSGDSVETTLDTEWSGAVAPKAGIKVVVAGSTNTADGVDLSAQYIVNNNVAPIVTVSYGSCEAYMGTTELAFYNSLWKQAAAQGMTVLVSSGDSGAAGCDGGSSTNGTQAGVNGLCSSPYAVCVGGTEFVEGSNPGQYWLSGNNAVMGSAQGYIPEAVWNESASNAGSGLWSGGGGASITYAKPTWQTGPGVPADGRRDVPDVSLSAASHDGYLIQYTGGLYSVGGTSAAAPSFAGLMALVNQKIGAHQGNPNSNLYALAAKQASGGSKIFNDITSGNNSVPGVSGFVAATGYDRSTGLGSVDANQLVAHWNDLANPTPTLTLTASPVTLTIAQGASQSATISVAVGGSFNSAVALAVAGAPTGVTATLSTVKTAAPGAGSSTLTVAVSKTAAIGTSTLTMTGTGGTLTSKATVQLTVQASGTFTVTASAGSLSIGQASSGSLQVNVAAQNGFNSAVTFSSTGLPSGISAAFAPATVTLSSSAASKLTLATAKIVPAGTYPLLIAATAGGITKTVTVNLIVTASASCKLSSNPASVNFVAGESTSFQVSCGGVAGFSQSALNLVLNGQPVSGVVIQILQNYVVPGGGGAPFAVTSAQTAIPGAYTATVTATQQGGGYSQTLSIPIVISAPTTILVEPAQNSVTLAAGSSMSFKAAIVHSGSFKSAVSLSIAGLPAGITGTLSPSSFAAPGDGTTTVTLTASPTAKASGYFVLAAFGGGLFNGAPIGITVTAHK